MRVGLLVLAMTGCVSIPPYEDGPLSARLVANAYRDGGEDDVAHGTPGMTKAGYSITTAGIRDGELVLFIANVDNGIDDLWLMPPGFTTLVNHAFGPDGQTYVAAWKIADHEPDAYTGMYAPANISAAATVSLVAVTGFDREAPVEAFKAFDHDIITDPADVGSPGLMTTVGDSLLVYAAGADWYGENGMNTFTPPDGFDVLTSIGDRETTWDWTSQSIATKKQPVSGSTGPLVATMAAVNPDNTSIRISGAGWSTLFAIAPAR